MTIFPSDPRAFGAMMESDMRRASAFLQQQSIINNSLGMLGGQRYPDSPKEELKPKTNKLLLLL